MYVCPVLPTDAQGGRREADGAYVLISPRVISRADDRRYHQNAIAAFSARHKCNSICQRMELDVSRRVRLFSHVGL